MMKERRVGTRRQDDKDPPEKSQLKERVGIISYVLLVIFYDSTL